jgi:hypothetical protein
VVVGRVAGELKHPDYKLCVSAVRMPIFQNSKKHLLDEVLAGVTPVRHTHEKVVQLHVVPLEQDAQFRDIAIADLKHELIICH